MLRHGQQIPIVTSGFCQESAAGPFEFVKDQLLGLCPLSSLYKTAKLRA